VDLDEVLAATFTPGRTASEDIGVDQQADEVAGQQHHGRADGDLAGEQAEEQRRLGEGARDRAFDPDGLRQRGGGRQRHHRGGQRGGAQ
jgi:hypothetical protein